MRALLATLWLVSYFLLARYGVYLLPAEVAQKTTLPTYLAGVQLVTIVLGVAGMLLATRHDPQISRDLLPLPWIHSPPAAVFRICIWALFLAPLTYLCAHALGMYFAFDTLLYELATRGTRAVQQQTGELGRSATQDPLLTILLFTLVVAPLGEELLFRGAIFGALQDLFGRFRSDESAAAVQEQDAPESLVVAGLGPRTKAGTSLAKRASGWIVAGGGAALVSGALFGALHADTPGGLGIVRLVSATVLGVACGFARASRGGLAASFALHVGYNFLALGTMRGWLVTVDYPSKYGIPTLLGPVSAVLCFVVLAHFLVAHFSRSRATRLHAG